MEDITQQQHKALLTASPDFLAALPEGHPLGFIVAAFMEGTRVSHDLSSDDEYQMDGFAATIEHSALQIAEHFSKRSNDARDMAEPVKRDSWDGCEYV